MVTDSILSRRWIVVQEHDEENVETLPGRLEGASKIMAWNLWQRRAVNQPPAEA